jgi:hypothetical protein
MANHLEFFQNHFRIFHKNKDRSDMKSDKKFLYKFNPRLTEISMQYLKAETEQITPGFCFPKNRSDKKNGS